MDSIREKTTAILQNLPKEIPAETTVLVNLVTLLLDQSEINNQKLTAFKSLVEVQKTVTDNLVVENKRLQKRCNELNKRLSHVEDRVDENEQHDRNRNLILKGVPEEDGPGTGREDTTKKFVDQINTHFKEENHLKMADIARSHRLGKRKNSPHQHPRPIIARFTVETKKMDTFRVKRDLARSGISLAENLTSYRNDLYQEAKKVLHYKNVWTWEGRVFSIKNGRKFHIASFADIPGYAFEDVEEIDADMARYDIERVEL